MTGLGKSLNINLTINQILKVRGELAELKEREEALVSNLQVILGHPEEAQRTYHQNLGGLTNTQAKITIKTGFNTTLDKNALNTMWSEDLPINRTYAYALRERDFKAAMAHGSPELRKKLSDVVTQKAAKPFVKIEFIQESK